MSSVSIRKRSLRFSSTSASNAPSSSGAVTAPWWLDVVVIIFLVLLFCYILRIIKRLSDKWKKYVFILSYIVLHI